MNISEDDLVRQPLAIDSDVFAWSCTDDSTNNEAQYKEQYSALRHKIVSSPITQKIYRLRYSTNKSNVGLENENSPNDGSIFTADMKIEFKQQNPDSLEIEMDDFDLESEMLKFTSKEDQQHEPIEIDLENEYAPELEEIFITIQHTSIKVNNKGVYELPSTIRSSTLLKGSKLEDGLYEEDSLLLTTSSGYLLLVRFYDDKEQIKPYVVQWWKLEANNTGLPRLSDTGRSVITHSSGLGFAVTAVQGIMRLFYCGQTQHGVMIDRLYNVPVDGTILHSCFLEQVKDSTTDGHTFIFSLVVTSHGRYLIKLVEWWIEESRILEHTPMVLVNDFGVPVFTVPVQDGVLLVMETRVVFVSLNQMLSADYSFFSMPFPGGFPVSYYKPETRITTGSTGAEILISTEDGTIYSLILNDKDIQITPILKIPKLSIFNLEKQSDGYHLIYSCDLGTGGYLILQELDIMLDVRQSSLVQTLETWHSWAPVLDVEVVDTKHNTQDLWVAHGKRLSKIKIGILAEKEITDYKLRKAYKVFHHIVNDEVYFIFSFVDKTLIFKYEEDELIAIADSGLDLVNRTVELVSFQGICFQITEDSIVVANFETDQLLRKELENDVIFADCYANFIAVVTDSETSNTTDLSVYEVSGSIDAIASLELKEEPNFVKFISFNDKLFLLVATSSLITFYLIEDNELIQINVCELSISEPHDLVAMNNVVYVSSRFGKYVVYDIVSDNGISLIERSKLKLTDYPIDFYLTEEFLLLISKNVWKLSLGASALPIPIVFQELRNRTVFSAIALDENSMAVLRSDGFSITKLSSTQMPIVTSIKTGQITKKVKYISHLGVFAIITETSLLFCNKLTKLEERLYSKKKTTSLFENEIPLSLAEWILPVTEKSYRNLLVGCYSNNGGSLKILQPKFNSSDSNVVEVYELFNIKTDGPVLATYQLDDTTILYSSGYKLYSTIYDVKAKKMLDSTCVHTFYSIIMSIDVKGDDVLVSTKDYSVTKLRRGLHAFTAIEEDAVSRKATNSLFMNDNVTITTDKLHCSITGVQDQNNRFKAYVPFVPKLKQCQFLPTWYSNDSLLRFLSFGFGGDIQIYTLLDKDKVKEYEKYYDISTFKAVNTVTKKGFWEINKGPWKDSRDINLFDSSVFDTDDTNLPESLKDLLSSVCL